jgi:FAD/FMN-containing dehydrogenase
LTPSLIENAVSLSSDPSVLDAFSTPLLRSGQDNLARYEQPARGAAGFAHAVAVPRTVDEVQQLVREAVEHRVRLLPQGANTGLVGSSVPPPPAGEANEISIVVSLEHLALPDGQRLHINALDGTAVVSAGVRLSELNEAAAPFGLHLPVDLSADPMLGGMVATNTGGSRVLRYGPMRHHVLAAQAVTADAKATLVGSLSALYKDSRGVDMAQLLVGSGGTLGIITGAVVALAPLPVVVQTWWVELPSAEAAPGLFSFLDRSRPASLSAFEFVSGAALERTLSLDGCPQNPFGPRVPEACALVEWSGSNLDALEEDLAAAAAEGLLVDAVLSSGESAWGIRHRVSESLRRFGVVLGHDVSTPLASVMLARRDAIAAVTAIAPHAVMCDFGHVGDGGLHLNVLLPADDPNLSALRVKVRAVIDDVIASYGGSYSAEHGLGPVNAKRWAESTPAVEQSIVAALKGAVDPSGILGHPMHPYNQLRIGL